MAVGDLVSAVAERTRATGRSIPVAASEILTESEIGYEDALALVHAGIQSVANAPLEAVEGLISRDLHEAILRGESPGAYMSPDDAAMLRTIGLADLVMLDELRSPARGESDRSAQA
jgi:hypothetical protein